MTQVNINSLINAQTLVGQPAPRQAAPARSDSPSAAFEQARATRAQREAAVSVSISETAASRVLEQRNELVAGSTDQSSNEPPEADGDRARPEREAPFGPTTQRRFAPPGSQLDIRI